MVGIARWSEDNVGGGDGGGEELSDGVRLEIFVGFCEFELSERISKSSIGLAVIHCLLIGYLLRVLHSMSKHTPSRWAPDEKIDAGFSTDSNQ